MPFNIGRRSRALIVVLAIVVVAVPTSDAQVDSSTFTIVVIPDTQSYVQSSNLTSIFTAQTQWIADNQQSRNIVFATHEGDASQNPSSATEWDRIEDAFAILDAADVPYAISPGNHDINPDGSAPEYDSRFAASRFTGQAWYGGNHAAEGNRSSYQTLVVGGRPLLFVHVRHLITPYGPLEPVLEWVDAVLADHPDHLTFVTTHEFTATNATIARPLLQETISDHCNVAVVFSGHQTGSGAARGTFADTCGRTIHHMLTNYQRFENGGNGYLRTVEIDNDTLQTSFEVYSPTLDEVRSGDAETFDALLAPLPVVDGDADCDGSLTIVDALAVAQFSAGLRSAQTFCPLGDPTAQINSDTGDVNGSGATDIVDALFIAQCTAGLPNLLCP